MKKATLVIVFLLLITSKSIAQKAIPNKTENNQINSKLWNKASMNHFINYIEIEIKGLLGDNNFKSPLINSWVEQIVDKSQKKLKSMKKGRYKYIADVIILPKGSGYKKNTSFWWQPKIDKTITVKVNTELLHCLLVIYCVRV